MNFSILATGGIAESIARDTLSKMSGISPYAVASRSLDRAEAFAEKWGFEKAYGSYEELAADPQAGLIYIATPNTMHFANAKLCLEHGRHVLLEKPFTMNAAEARELIALSEEKNLLLAEAIWTRYLPGSKKLEELLAQDTIGRITAVDASLGNPVTFLPRLVEPELGGGAILDLGIYVLQFMRMAIKEEITGISSAAVFTDRGLDASNTTILTYKNGAVATLQSSMTSRYANNGIIYGEKGILEMENINTGEGLCLRDCAGNLIERYETPREITGYEYEIRACAKAIAGGSFECPEVPHSETLLVMELMDHIRECW